VVVVVVVVVEAVKVKFYLRLLPNCTVFLPEGMTHHLLRINNEQKL
jgi:hypothetical protein